MTMTCLAACCSTVTFCSLVELERVLGLGLGAQPLDRGHDVRLPGEDGAAELLGPAELVVHHLEDARGATSDLTLACQTCLSSAEVRAVPVRLLFAAIQWSASTISIG